MKIAANLVSVVLWLLWCILNEHESTKTSVFSILVLLVPFGFKYESEASSQNWVAESKLNLLEGKIVLKRLGKPLFGLMESLETTEFQISLETPSFDSWEKLEMKWHRCHWRRELSSVPFYHTSSVKKTHNSPWNLLMQKGSSTRGVFWKVKESINYLGNGKINFTGSMDRMPKFVLMKILCSPHCE